MDWLLRRCDSLVATVFGAVAGLSASQFLTFIQQYRQRLAGHLDEAERTLREVLEGPVHRDLEPAVRDKLAGGAAARVDELARAYDALAGGGALERPLAFLRHADWGIARNTLNDFQPALPLDTVSLAYAFAGLVAGWLLWELLKAPARPVVRAMRRPGRIRESRPR
ncbi:MAG: DUF2937 family protein [Acetobacterales bacterium]